MTNQEIKKILSTFFAHRVNVEVNRQSDLVLLSQSQDNFALHLGIMPENAEILVDLIKEQYKTNHQLNVAARKNPHYNSVQLYLDLSNIGFISPYMHPCGEIEQKVTGEKQSYFIIKSRKCSKFSIAGYIVTRKSVNYVYLLQPPEKSGPVDYHQFTRAIIDEWYRNIEEDIEND